MVCIVLPIDATTQLPPAAQDRVGRDCMKQVFCNLVQPATVGPRALDSLRDSPISFNLERYFRQRSFKAECSFSPTRRPSRGAAGRRKISFNLERSLPKISFKVERNRSSRDPESESRARGPTVGFGDINFGPKHPTSKGRGGPLLPLSLGPGRKSAISGRPRNHVQ